MNERAERLRGWSPPEGWIRMLAVDAHTEGEPLRVVVSGFPELEGRTVLERRREAREKHDDLRRALMWEPRGHADMYGCLVGPAITPEADLSVLFTHNAGFSTMCGHGIIGIVTAVLETGVLLPSDTVAGRESGGDDAVVVGIDTPAGFVRARAALEAGRVEHVSFVNVPSFLSRLDARVDVPDVGSVRYDLAYGGAFYAYVAAGDLGLSLVPAETARLVDLGRKIKAAVQRHDRPVHPDDPELGFVYGTIFVGEAHEPGHQSRNVCVFADGEVDRSPTGTGVSGRLAVHHARGDIGVDEPIVVESILGTCFTARVVGTTSVSGLDAVIPEVTGRAWITGINELLVDPSDPLARGFLLR
jgi:proline racemase